MTETVVTDAPSEPRSQPSTDLGRIAADSASRRSKLDPTKMVIRSEKLDFFYDHSAQALFDVDINVLRFVGYRGLCSDPALIILMFSCENFDHR